MSGLRVASLVMGIVCVAVGVLEGALPQTPAGSTMTVTLLGTGTPLPRLERLGPATLVEAGGQRLLFDVGRGTIVRLAQAKIPAASIDAVFLTHLHSDHVVGLPDLWLTARLPPLGGRTTAWRVLGPAGTRAMTDALRMAFSEDVRMRTVEERLSPGGSGLEGTDVSAGTVVFDRGGVQVTAFAVDHGGELRPAYGYRVQYGKRSVVLSGDTRASSEVVRQSTGADVLLHEVFAAPDTVTDDPSVRFRAAHHTSPGEAARVFAQAEPRLAVFTHVALAPGKDGRPPSPEAILADVRRGYAGRVEVGEDLMQIEIGDEVVVRRAPVVARP